MAPRRSRPLQSPDSAAQSQQFLGGGTGSIAFDDDWNFGNITATDGNITGNGTLYGWQLRSLDGTGNLTTTLGVASGHIGNGTPGNVTSFPAKCLTGDTLSVGDDVLIRPGPMCGGTFYEVVPMPKPSIPGTITLATISQVDYYPAFGTDGSTTWVGYYEADAQQVTNDYVLANAAPLVHFTNVLAAWPSYFKVGDSVAVFPVQGYGGDGNYANATGNNPYFAMPACRWGPHVTTFVGNDADGGIGTVYDATPSDDIILVNANEAACEVFLFQPYQINTNKVYTVKKTDPSTNAITIVGGGFNIDGASSVTLSQQYDFVTMVADGNNSGPAWWITAYQVGGAVSGL